MNIFRIKLSRDFAFFIYTHIFNSNYLKYFFYP